MTIKAMTPSLSLVIVFFTYCFHSDIITQNIGGVIRHIVMISDNFLLQDFFDIFSCLTSEVRLLLTSIFFCWIALFGLG
jgi:hypothetical protein